MNESTIQRVRVGFTVTPLTVADYGLPAHI
jgi:hypothetical protein